MRRRREEAPAERPSLPKPRGSPTAPSIAGSALRPLERRHPGGVVELQTYEVTSDGIMQRQATCLPLTSPAGRDVYGDGPPRAASACLRTHDA